MKDSDPIDQPCAYCGERVTGDASDDHLHVIDVPAWDVRIVHHVAGGDAPCCLTSDPECDVLLDEGCPDARLRAALRRVMARGPWAWRRYLRGRRAA